MKYLDISPDSIPQIFLADNTPKELHKYFIDLNDSRAIERKSTFLSPACYERIMIETIISLFPEERIIFLQKHFYCYSNLNLRWFSQLKKLLTDVQFFQKNEFIELIDDYIDELKSVKEMGFNKKWVYALGKLAESEAGMIDMTAILGLERMESNTVGQYLRNQGYIQLYAHNLAEIKPAGMSYWDSIKEQIKLLKNIVYNLQKLLGELDNLEKEKGSFLDWCDDVSRYLELANELRTVSKIEDYEQTFDNINMDNFKSDMSKSISKIIKFIKENDSIRFNPILIAQDNSRKVEIGEYHNMGASGIIVGNGNDFFQNNNKT